MHTLRSHFSGYAQLKLICGQIESLGLLPATLKSLLSPPMTLEIAKSGYLGPALTSVVPDGGRRGDAHADNGQ